MYYQKGKYPCAHVPMCPCCQAGTWYPQGSVVEKSGRRPGRHRVKCQLCCACGVWDELQHEQDNHPDCDRLLQSAKEVTRNLVFKNYIMKLKNCYNTSYISFKSRVGVAWTPLFFPDDPRLHNIEWVSSKAAHRLENCLSQITWQITF